MIRKDAPQDATTAKLTPDDVGDQDTKRGVLGTPANTPTITQGNANPSQNDNGIGVDGKPMAEDPDGNSADSVAVDQKLDDNIKVESQFDNQRMVMAILIGTGITSAITLLIAIVGVAVFMAMKGMKPGSEPLANEGQYGEEYEEAAEAEDHSNTAHF